MDMARGRRCGRGRTRMRGSTTHARLSRGCLIWHLHRPIHRGHVQLPRAVALGVSCYVRSAVHIKGGRHSPDASIKGRGVPPPACARACARGGPNVQSGRCALVLLCSCALVLVRVCVCASFVLCLPGVRVCFICLAALRVSPDGRHLERLPALRHQIC